MACGPPGGLTLVRNGYNEHLAGSRAFRGHWRQSWDRGIFPLCPSIWHCLTFSFRDRGPAGLQVRLEGDGEQEMEPACANPPTNPSPCVRLYICQHLPVGGLAPPFLQPFGAGSRVRYSASRGKVTFPMSRSMLKVQPDSFFHLFICSFNNY